MTSNQPTLLHSSNPSDVESACKPFGISTEQFSTLHSRCAAAKATAYCPYSRFRVGATILTEEGAFVDGANVENASYPVGTCAERVAFGKAVTEGHKKFKAVAVATDISPPASPCGMCRQLVTLEDQLLDTWANLCDVNSIREFCDLSMPIFMFDKNGDFVVMKLESLLPLSFGPEALPPPEALP
ncbi:cytidine deaminase protein [Rutstroemia sp. NJR-2017a WRK4]|nr:cytidine deaminase protein [Rutstroemia sp. NJR-2017a WRK4]